MRRRTFSTMPLFCWRSETSASQKLSPDSKRDIQNRSDQAIARESISLPVLAFVRLRM